MRRRCVASAAGQAGYPGLIAVCLLLSACGLLITPQHRIAVARKDIKIGYLQGAAAELRTVIQGHPDNAEAWQLLAQVSYDAGDISGARSSLNHAIATGAKGPELDALRLQVWLAEGRPKDVIAAINGHTVHPGEPTASIDLARAYDATGQEDKAVSILQPLITQHRDLTMARVALAEAFARQGKPDQALQQLDTAMQRDTQSAQPPLLKGRILAARGQYPAAEEALTLALKRMTPAEPIFYRTGALVVLTEARLAQGKIAAATESQQMLAKMAPSAPASQFLAGRIDIARGNLSAGTNALQGVVARAPGFMEARLYLGAAELAQGNLQQAQQQLEQVVQAAPDNVEARNLLATVRLRLGNPEAALSVLTPALDSEPVNPGLLSLLGRAGGPAGDTKPAVQALERKLQADSKDQTAALNLARLQAATGDLAGAKKTLDTALAANPEALPIRLALVGVLVRTKAFPQALTLLKAADKPGAGPGIKLAIARVQLAQGDLRGAQGTLDEAIAAHSTDAALVEDAGVLLLEANQYGAALARFAQATVLAPNNALYWLDSARAQLALNDPAARTSLLKAAGIRPNWPPVVGILAFMDLHAGKSSAALQRVNALVVARPKDAAALALKGYVESAAGNSGAAMTAYTQAQALHPTAQVALQLYRLRLASHDTHPQKPLEDWLAREPGDWRVHEILGEYYLGTHALHPAAKQFEATVRQAPDNVVALNNLAWVYSHLDDPRAESIAERAYKLAPKVPQVIDTLGWILARQHQAERAVPLLARAASLSPGDPEIDYHYAYALSSSGKSGEARRVLARLLSTSKPFQSRADAQRLLAALKHT